MGVLLLFLEAVVILVLQDQGEHAFELLLGLLFGSLDANSTFIANAYGYLRSKYLPAEEALWSPVRLRGSLENTLSPRLTIELLKFLVSFQRTQLGTFMTTAY